MTVANKREAYYNAKQSRKYDKNRRFIFKTRYAGLARKVSVKQGFFRCYLFLKYNCFINRCTFFRTCSDPLKSRKYRGFFFFCSVRFLVFCSVARDFQKIWCKKCLYSLMHFCTNKPQKRKNACMYI